MQRRKGLYLSVLVFIQLFLTTAALTQGPAPQSNPGIPVVQYGGTPPLPTLPAIIEREPGSPTDVMYIINEYGRIVPVLIDVPLEQIDALRKLLLRQDSEPLYSIQSLTAEGLVGNNTANLTIRLQIQTRNESIIRIPIGLKSGIFPFEMDLSQAAQYGGPSLFYIVANPQGKGYDIILRAKPVDSVISPMPLESASRMLEVLEPPPIEPDEDKVPDETMPESETMPAMAVAQPVDQPTSFLLDADASREESETQNIWHTVTLRMTFPVTQQSVNEYQLRAEFPEAFRSHIQLVVPQPDVVVLQSKGGSLHQTIPRDEHSTAFVFQRIQSDFEVQWQEKQHALVRERVVLQVENGSIIARVAPTGVVFDATIPVWSSGGTFDFFQLQLPRGAVFRPTLTPETTEYQVEVLTPEQQDAPETLPDVFSQKLLVRLSQPTEGSVPVRIQAETPFNHSQNGWFEVGGFEVTGAEKQFGRLSVVVEPETRLRQKESRGIRPAIDAAMSDAEGIVTGFDYYVQPCSLLVQAVPQASRANLRPEYQVQIYHDRAVLRAKLSYTIHGGLNPLAIDMNGWQLTDIGPEKVVNRYELPFKEGDPVTITLQEPAGKNFELNLQAVYFFDPKDDLVRFSFPIPQADFIEPALVAIIPENNIELTVDESHPLVEMSLKSHRDTPLQIELPVRQQGALVYRIDNPAKAEFCAKVTLHQQRITVQSHTELTLQSDDLVKQTLDYTVEYEPVLRLILAVPSELDSQGDLRVVLDSLELKLFNMSEMAGIGNLQNGVVLKQVRLPDAIIGKFQLALDFKLTNQIRDDLAQKLPTSTVQVKVPVVLPRDGQLVQETVRIRYPRGLQLTHDEEATGWKKKESPGLQHVASSRSESIYQTETATPLLLLGAALKKTDRPSVTTIEKGWVKSWLLGSGRMDCACYKVSTNLSHITMKLPRQVQADRINIKIVKVDDQKVEADQNGNELRIPLIPLSNDATSVPPQSSLAWLDLPESEFLRTVEIWYEIPQVTSLNHLELELPSFPSEAIVRPVYCQVILPASRHLLSCNPEWMPQFQWSFDGGFFSRTPKLTQQELEAWIGVPHGELISSTWNSYLFISFHPGSKIQLDLADRSTLILVSSGIILLLGLILIYFPRTRYPGVLFTSLVLFISAFAYRTTMAILFLQAGVIGFILALIAMFLYWMFVSTDPWRSAAFGSLSVSGWKDLSRFGRREISSVEHHSDSTAGRVVSSDPVASEFRDLKEEPVLPIADDHSPPAQNNGLSVLRDDANTTDVPAEKERNGHA